MAKRRDGGPRSRRRRRRTGCLLAVVAAVALALAGCTADGLTGADVADGDDAGTTGGPAAGVGTGSLADVPEIVREVSPSTVAIHVVAQRQGQTARGVGSGVIVRPGGAIVTNHHVVVGAEQIEVVLANGERHPAQVVATDPRTDLAVISVDVDDLPAAEFADRLPDLGELAVALGSPLGFQNTVTAGIVSGLDRTLPVSPQGPILTGLLQTDASISSGNSGGALVDARGRVIGINVAAIGDVPAGVVAEDVGFAIPSTTVTSVVEQLLDDGEVAHAFLGIRGGTLTPQVAERFGIDIDAGVVVGQVVPDSPAARAGLQPGDVIVGLAGADIGSLGDLLSTLRQHAPGDTVSLTYVRDGQRQQVEVTLAELPER